MELVSRLSEQLLLQVVIPYEHILALLAGGDNMLSLNDTITHAIAVSLNYTAQGRLLDEFYSNVFEQLQPPSEEQGGQVLVS